MINRSGPTMSKTTPPIMTTDRPADRGAFARWSASVAVALALLAGLEGLARLQAPGASTPPVLRLELLRLPAPPTAAESSPVAFPPQAPLAASPVAKSTSRASAVPRAPAPLPTPPAREAPPILEPAAVVEAAAMRPASGEPERAFPPPARDIPPRPPTTGSAPPDGAAPVARVTPAGLEPMQAAPLPVRSQPAPAVPPPARLVRSDELDAGFRLLAPVSPAYPERARRLARPGLVELELEVAADGRVTRIDVLAESRGWGFGAEARRAFAAARFTPPTVAGRPVRVLWRRTLHFRP